MQKICYVEETASSVMPPSGYKARQASGGNTMCGTVWFRRKPSVPWLVVYKDECQHGLTDLEVVSLVHNNRATGYMCSCDIAYKIADPESLIADLGDKDGVVTESTLENYIRPRITEILKDLGTDRALDNKSAWPELRQAVRERLGTPPGVLLDEFTLREVCNFDKRIEEVRVIADFRLALEAAERDGRIKRAVEAHREEELLAELGEQRVKSLLARRERQQSAAKRLKKYIRIVGLTKVLSQMTDLHTTQTQILDRMAALLERDTAGRNHNSVPSSPFRPEQLRTSNHVVGGSELTAVLDQLEQLQLSELTAALDELECIHNEQGKE